jgi:hypothetical protein
MNLDRRTGYVKVSEELRGDQMRCCHGRRGM